MIRISPVSLLTRTICVLAILIIFYTDIALPKLIEISDYTTTFYSAGRIIAEGRIGELYPLATDTTLANTAFDKFSHQILPNLPPFLASIFPYPPLVGALFVPLAGLSPAYSLLVFQALSIAGLAACAYLCGRSEKLSAINLFSLAFLFIPVPLVIWIGQLDLLAGATVLAVTYFLLQDRRFFAAGLVASLTAIKLQLLLVPGFIAVHLLLSRRNWKYPAGLYLGLVLMAAANIAIFGMDTCLAWLNSLKLTEAVYLDPASGVARHMAVSIPRFLLWLAPADYLPICRVLVYGGALSLVVAALSVCYKFSQKVSEESALALTLIVGSLLIPLVSPHQFYYNLSSLVVAGFLAFGANIPKDIAPQIKSRITFLWITISLYPLLFIVSKSMFLPLLIMIPTLAVFANILVLLSRKQTSTPAL